MGMKKKKKAAQISGRGVSGCVLISGLISKATEKGHKTHRKQQQQKY